MQKTDPELLDLIGTKIEGVWLPKQEEHLTEWMLNSKGAHREEGKITYQWAKQVAALRITMATIPDAHEKLFIDVGAHVGLWSMWWAKWMSAVLAFEPIGQMHHLYRGNMEGLENYELRGVALGDERGYLTLSFNPENTGNTHKAHDKDEEGLNRMVVPLIPLDDVFRDEPQLIMPVGAIKIDCEGTEEAVVRGAERTIKKHKPVIIVEQKKGAEYYGADPLGAVKLLQSFGYKTAKVMSGDHIMVPE